MQLQLQGRVCLPGVFQLSDKACRCDSDEVVFDMFTGQYLNVWRVVKQSGRQR